jgi:hypothetical protein
MTYSGRQFPRTTKLRKEFSEMESGMQGTVDLDADNTKRGKTFMVGRFLFSNNGCVSLSP